MPIEVQNEREAKVLAEAVKSGAIPAERQAEAMSALRSHLAANPSVEAEPAQEDGAIKKTLKGAVGVGEVGLTIATGGLAEIAGGFGAAIKSLFGQGIDESVADIEATSDFFTFQPRTDAGKKILETIAVPLMALERGADRVAEVGSGGNPYAATLIKTALLGGLELAVPGKTATARVGAGRKIAKQKKNLVKTADELGIDLDPREMEASIVDAAKKMTPEQRAANAPDIQKAMQQAAEAGRIEKNALFNIAQKKKAYVRADSVREFSTGLRRSLEERGFDLDPDIPEMARVRKRLKNLDDFGAGLEKVTGDAKALVRLNELERIRRKVNKSFGADRQANAALTSVRRGIDEFLDNQFDQAAIRGDKTAIQAWKDARGANRRWHQNFTEDKILAKLIDQDATPETISQWLTGASAMGARKEAASTVARMKKVLGDNHPAIEGVRQDFLFNVAEPLLKEKPNFGQFVRQYEATIRRNPSLVKELGLKQSDMNQLYRFAKEQENLPVGVIKTLDLYRATSQFLVGHQIARAGLRVKLAEGFARLASGADRVTKKRIISELTGAMYDQPAVPKTSKLAGEFIAGAALTGVPDAQEVNE